MGTMPALIAPRNTLGKSIVSRMRQHDAVFLREAEARQCIRGAIHALGQLAVGDAAGIVDERGLAGAPGAKIALDQVIRGVEVARISTMGGLTLWSADDSPGIPVSSNQYSVVHSILPSGSRYRISARPAVTVGGVPFLEHTPASRRHGRRTSPPA